ncbi:MAG: hypothetical protein J7L73_05795 [Anaerolineales bacterium]|nr:hypothetical protein [Anaerolineales bacterium]HEY62767.1 hypothetical protein [Anaerolineae bacterium]
MLNHNKLHDGTTGLVQPSPAAHEVLGTRFLYIYQGIDLRGNHSLGGSFYLEKQTIKNGFALFG